MSYVVLWLDHENAKFFSFTPGQEDSKHLKNERHLNHHSGHHEGEKHEHQKKFYEQVQNQLKGASEILLVGPGLAKNEFRSFLEKHHGAQIAKSIVGVETMDKMTDGQIKDLARKYFQKYNLFH